MDPATIIGLVLAFGSIGSMVVLEGSSVSSLLLPAPMILVFGATIAVGIASGTIPDMLRAAKALPRALRGRLAQPVTLIDQVVSIADRARKEGLLALEAEAQNVKDPFLKAALQNIADGMDAEELRNLLEEQVATEEREQRAAAKFFNGLGGYAPTIGIIGTVISLTHVLEHLSDPATLGPSIAGAFVATLWGVLSANIIWLPLGARLSRLADLNIERMHVLLEGVLAVQEGSQPRVVGERLRAMITVTDSREKGSKGIKEPKDKGKPMKEAA
ncbi:motility protein A [Lysinimonas soli]|uniref:Motility protein A n=1 Tax=Lysinimonas soli TaxID=1074233 RepID=A0ABW0NP58_9MICO